MPIEQVGNAVTFYAFYTDGGAGATGLTVTIDVWEVQTDGTATEIVTGGSVTEIGDGLYRYILVSGSVDEEGEYVGVFKTAGTADQQHVAAIWVINRAGVENLNAPLATIDTNVDAILLDTGTDGVAISQAIQQAIADEILKRGIVNVEDTADATSLAALVLAAFESVIVGALWTIYKTDHSTTFTTKPIVTSPAADPITEVG